MLIYTVSIQSFSLTFYKVNRPTLIENAHDFLGIVHTC